MPRVSFLAHLGMFVIPRFLDADRCGAIRREMRECARDPARILDGESKFVVDPEKRKTEVALVSPQTRTQIKSRLMAAVPAIEKHFGVPLLDCEPPSFLIYETGFYYGRHVDANHSPQAPSSFRSRRVSISIFLNGEGQESEPDTYSGGSLAFSGTRQENEHGGHLGVVLTGEEGLLIGFDSDWPHEVQPVRRGTRYSIVTWFF